MLWWSANRHHCQFGHNVSCDWRRHIGRRGCMTYLQPHVASQQGGTEFQHSPENYGRTEEQSGTIVVRMETVRCFCWSFCSVRSQKFQWSHFDQIRYVQDIQSALLLLLSCAVPPNNCSQRPLCSLRDNSTVKKMFGSCSQPPHGPIARGLVGAFRECVFLVHWADVHTVRLRQDLGQSSFRLL